MRTTEEISLDLIQKVIPKEQVKEVFKNNKNAYGDICAEFLGFMQTYEALSFLIEKHWTIIDIGCAYNAQSWLLTDFAKVISVEPSFKENEPIFQAPNNDIYRMTGGEFIKNILPTLGLDLRTTFCIENYNPSWYDEDLNKIVSNTFKNLYIYYPYHEGIRLKKNKTQKIEYL